jgi:Restriction Enzyme Adenine Methylase Associated
VHELSATAAPLPALVPAQTLPYQDFLAKRRHLMAAVVKEAFGLLADHSYDPAYPAPTAVEEPGAPGGWTGYGISVKDLLTAELLAPGTLLLPTRDDLDAIAEVLPDGRIRLDEEIHDTPSGAARAAVGMAANGWTFWIADTAEGPRKLAELRAHLVGDLA